jgi:hypothetical protein
MPSVTIGEAITKNDAEDGEDEELQSSLLPSEFDNARAQRKHSTIGDAQAV